MAAIGSVFLGDIQQRLRLLSSTSPPASPSPTLSPSAMSKFAHAAATSMLPSSPSNSKSKPADETTTPHISPELSLELRLRWLEAILVGVRQNEKIRTGKDKGLSHALKHGETLLRLAEDIQRRLNSIVQNNDGLRRFMDHCQWSRYESCSAGVTEDDQTTNMLICSHRHSPSLERFR